MRPKLWLKSDYVRALVACFIGVVVTFLLERPERTMEAMDADGIVFVAVAVLVLAATTRFAFQESVGQLDFFELLRKITPIIAPLMMVASAVAFVAFIIIISPVAVLAVTVLAVTAGVNWMRRLSQSYLVVCTALGVATLMARIWIPVPLELTITGAGAMILGSISLLFHLNEDMTTTLTHRQS